MGGRPCAKAVLDGGKLAAAAVKIAAMAKACEETFRELYKGGDLTEEQIGQAMELSYDMCEWAERTDQWTAKMDKFYTDIVGSEIEGYPKSKGRAVRSEGGTP